MIIIINIIIIIIIFRFTPNSYNRSTWLVRLDDEEYYIYIYPVYIARAIFHLRKLYYAAFLFKTRPFGEYLRMSD